MYKPQKTIKSVTVTGDARIIKDKKFRKGVIVLSVNLLQISIKFTFSSNITYLNIWQLLAVIKKQKLRVFQATVGYGLFKLLRLSNDWQLEYNSTAFYYKNNRV